MENTQPYGTSLISYSYTSTIIKALASLKLVKWTGDDRKLKQTDSGIKIREVQKKTLCLILNVSSLDGNTTRVN